MPSADSLFALAAEQAARNRTDANRRNLLEQAAHLSLEVEHDMLKNGPIRFIVASGHQRAVDAFTELATIDATDVAGILKLQNTIVRYSDMLGWLYTALQQGETARKELDGATLGLMEDTFTIRDGEDG